VVEAPAAAAPPVTSMPEASTADLTWLPVTALLGLATVGIVLLARGRGRAAPV
jgi:hypothetical protein